MTQSPVPFSRLLSALGLNSSSGPDPLITGLAVDSRDVKPGFLFAALPGTNAHGIDFSAYAIRMEAAAILTDAEGARRLSQMVPDEDIPVVITPDPRMVLARVAARWFDLQPEVVVAVTGTNGKTSVANFTRQIWRSLGQMAVNFGTTGVEGDFDAPLQHTTPEPITLHRLLADLSAAGITHAAMEASSHGLAQKRLDGVTLTAAAFTNFTQDHLDYHVDFEEYFDAKMGLFERILPFDRTAVINLDDDRAQEVMARCSARGMRLLKVGSREGADLQILAQRFDASGQTVRYKWGQLVQQSHLALIGGFQASNVMMAAGLAIACGEDAGRIFETFPQLTTVPGRMQLAATRENGAIVFVDYAHTPDALETALKAMRPHVMGRLVVVFGAGGDRDKGKRILMGQAAAAHADVVFVTDDNPRSEVPADIRAAIMEGCPNANNIDDRARAIVLGVDCLSAGDALLIAGKGHEKGQTIGDDVLPFDDVEQASVAVAVLDGKGA
jgi:UDP-N-acetylmuramoyl-L-alanyl-D-glutamate--2,6-diaminopimelate ligase